MKSKIAGRSLSVGTRQSQKHPVQKVELSSDFYVTLLNYLITSLLGEWAPKLDRLENLPRLIKSYEASALLVREADTDLYYRYIQCSAFLKKLELPLFIDAAKEKALQKWLVAEAQCKEMNEKIWEIKTHPLTHSHCELADVLQKVRREIYPLLGDVPPDLYEVAQYMGFGPGATLSHSREEGASVFKILNSSAYIGMEDEVKFLLSNTLFRDFLLEANPSLACVLTKLDAEGPQVWWWDEAKYDTVPKSTEETRSIEIGPSLAIFVQKAYDGWLRTEMKNQWGLDLRFQVQNKILAHLGSIMGEKPNSPCTIDLTSASDLISFGVIVALLPPSWVRTLMRYRATQVRLPDGTLQRLEKFSSMGNALTFSLETLIFAAVVRSVLRERGWEGAQWRVYGDDIVVPHRIYEDVVYRLKTLGFLVNESKSFSTGYFRESCGGDYLHGTFVRPIYLKKPLSSIPEVFRFLNRLSVHAMLCPIPAQNFEAVFRHVLSVVPKPLRVYGDTNSDPGSCIWTPQCFRSRDEYVERRSEIAIPDKLGYASKLLTGYTPPVYGSQKRYVGGFLPTGLELVRTGWGGRSEVLQGRLGAPLQAHNKPIAPGRLIGTFRRRAARCGHVAHSVPRELLPFDPMLMD